MAYNFKKINDVPVVEAMKDNLNVFIEDGGKMAKIPANKMIPEDVALKSDIPESIPVPATAEVGQVIAVKTVDENGKPTEWEAVAVGGGISCFYASNGYLYHCEQVGPYAGPGEKITKEEFIAAVMKGPIYTGSINGNGTFDFTQPKQISYTNEYGYIFDANGDELHTAEWVDSGPV